MQKLMSGLFMVTLLSVATLAQTSEYKKGEIFVGYSNQQVDYGTGDLELDELGVDDRATFHGFNVSGVYNVSRYFGIKGDVSGAYNSRRYDFSDNSIPVNRIAFDASNSLYNFLGGVQIKDNASEKRVKPFAHALAGIGRASIKVTNLVCSPLASCTDFSGTSSETGLAGAFGGGIDVKLTDRIDIRVIQADYNPIRVDGTTTHNFRFGFGFVFK